VLPWPASPGFRAVLGTALLCLALSGPDAAAAVRFAAPFRALSVDSLPVTVEIADLDADGFLDLVASCAGAGSLALQWGERDSASYRSASLLVGAAPGPLAIGDLDGDGDLDLVVAHAVTDTITVFAGDGARGFAPAVRLVTPSRSPT
jgi:hypothetical protein